MPREGQKMTQQSTAKKWRFSPTNAEEDGLAGTSLFLAVAAMVLSTESSLSLQMTSCLGINRHVYNQTYNLIFLCI